MNNADLELKRIKADQEGWNAKCEERARLYKAEYERIAAEHEKEALNSRRKYDPAFAEEERMRNKIQNLSVLMANSIDRAGEDTVLDRALIAKANNDYTALADIAKNEIGKLGEQNRAEPLVVIADFLATNPQFLPQAVGAFISAAFFAQSNCTTEIMEGASRGFEKCEKSLQNPLDRAVANIVAHNSTFKDCPIRKPATEGFRETLTTLSDLDAFVVSLYALERTHIQENEIYHAAAENFGKYCFEKYYSEFSCLDRIGKPIVQAYRWGPYRENFKIIEIMNVVAALNSNNVLVDHPELTLVSEAWDSFKEKMNNVLTKSQAPDRIPVSVVTSIAPLLEEAGMALQMKGIDGKDLSDERPVKERRKIARLRIYQIEEILKDAHSAEVTTFVAQFSEGMEDRASSRPEISKPESLLSRFAMRPRRLLGHLTDPRRAP